MWKILNKLFSKSPRLLLSSILSLALTMSVANVYCLVRLAQNFGQQGLWLLLLTSMVQIFSSTLAAVVCLYSSFTMCSTWKNVLKEMLSVPFTRPTEAINTWFYIASGIIIVNLIFDAWFYVKRSWFLMFTCNYLPEIVANVFLIQFLVPVQMVSEQFDTMSHQLKSFRNREDAALLEDTWAIVMLSKKLMKLSETLNDMFSVSLLIIITASTILSTTSLYTYIGYVTGIIPVFKNSKWVLNPYSFFLTSLISLYKLWCISHLPAVTTQKMEKFYSELYTLCIDDKTRKLIGNDMMNIYLERRESLKFSAHKFFPLDHSLFHSMLSKTATCLFIIIQFQIHDSSTCSTTIT